MTHIHAKTGLRFECGVYDDIDRKTTYDIIIITLWDHDDESPIKLVNYYFGDYTVKDTDYYIDEWLKTVPPETICKIKELQATIKY